MPRRQQSFIDIVNIKNLQSGAYVSDDVLTLYWTDIPNVPTLVNDWIGG